MTQEEKKWLIINRDRFFETNIPALQILDSFSHGKDICHQR